MTRTFAALAILLVSLFAGCLGGGTGPGTSLAVDGGPTTGSISQSEAPAPPEEKLNQSRGHIQGVVVNDNNATLADVHISLVGGQNFTKSDSNGRFAIPGIRPGHYRLRADRIEYESVEDDVEVKAGIITFARVVMVPIVKTDAGFRDHAHNLWGEEERYTLFEGNLEWPKDDELLGPYSATGACATTPTSSNTITYNDCYRIRVKIGNAIVRPGSGEMQATAKWKDQAYVKEVRLQYTTANATNLPFKIPGREGPAPPGFGTNIPKILVLPNGVMKNRVLDPKDPDHGHAKFSAWTFYLVLEFKIGDAVVYNNPELIRSQIGTIHLKIEFLKGFVPTDPPHPHYWINGSRLLLVDGLKNAMTVIRSDRDPTAQEAYDNVPWMQLPERVLVPPGATKLEVTLTYKADTAALEPYFSKKTLAFRTGGTNPEFATLAGLRVETAKQKDPGITKYELVLADTDTDAFYYGRSLWLFLLANDGDERGPTFTNECTTGCGKTTFTLRVEAVNENWDADFKAGRI